MLSGVLIRLSALKEYEDSELTAARIAAALGMYIRKGDGQSYEPDGNGSKVRIGTIRLHHSDFFAGFQI
ncbi:hypothetical protein ACT453_59210, partial [Bacillus sp. D-CC]